MQGRVNFLRTTARKSTAEGKLFVFVRTSGSALEKLTQLELGLRGVTDEGGTRLEEMVKLVGKPVQRFSNSHVGSEPFGKVSTLLLYLNGFSVGKRSTQPTRCATTCAALNPRSPAIRDSSANTFRR
jgi:hypothetical protein